MVNNTQLNSIIDHKLSKADSVFDLWLHHGLAI